MVNLTSIIHITNRGTFHFGSFPEFWNHCYSRTATSNKSKMDRLLQLMSICDQTISDTYFIPLAQTKHIGFVYMSASEAVRRMTYPQDRKLLTNPSNEVVLQIREKPNLTQTVATVYTENDYHIITSASNMTFAPGLIINLSENNRSGRQF